MDSLFVICIAVVALTVVEAHSTNGCSTVCPQGRYPNSCVCKQIGLAGIIDESGRIGNGFGGIGNGFEGIGNGFGGTGNGFEGIGDGFRGNGNGFGGIGGSFPGNAGDIGCNLIRCGAYETCTLDFGRPRCVRNPMFPGDQAPLSGVCYLPKVTGRCRAYFRRFYFNTQTQRCQRFVYGGCGGNGNNFRTFQECRRVCMRGSGGRRY